MAKPNYLHLSRLPAPPKTDAKDKSGPVSVDKSNAPKPPPGPDVRHAFVEAHKPNVSAVTSLDKVDNVYAIIGRGFAATLNLATLLKSDWGRERLAGCSVVFIGFKDPWQTYVKHGMNQEVELLTLPGFENRPALPGPLEATRWLWSTIFADLTAAELEVMIGKYKERITFLDAVVVTVAMDDGKKAYKITLKDRDPIFAKYVDVCVGTGQAQLIREAEKVMSPELLEEYQNPMKMEQDEPVTTQPRVFAAEMYVRKNVKAAIGGGRSACFHGASPASIQALEHALGMDGAADTSKRVEEAFIYSTQPAGMNEGFLPGGRLDDLARLADGKPLRKRHDTTECGPLIPSMNGIWFGEGGFKITKIETTSDYDFLTVTFDGGKRLVSKDGNVTEGTPQQYLYGYFEQVVLGSGRRRDGYTLLADGVWKTLKPVLYRGKYLVAAETDDKRVRLLGGSALNFLTTPASDPVATATQRKDIGDFQKTLPCQARVNLEGVTVCGLTIAYANHYFTADATKCNHNVNTAPLEDLTAVLGDGDLADKIVQARTCRISPFKNYEHLVKLIERFQTKSEVTAKSGADLAKWTEFINNYNSDESFLDPVRFAVWDQSPEWKSKPLSGTAKDALKKLTFSYGENELGLKPDFREYGTWT